MKKLILIFILSLLPSLALAQTSRNPCFINATGGCTPVSTTNPLPVDATVNASVTGFEPAATGTPINVTTLGATGTLPAGDVVAVFNVGTTNTAYCKLGASSTTSDIAIPPASWFAFTVGAATQLTCITSTSTTTVNMVGGTGLPTGAGGGGGGSGGGAITIASGAVAAGAYSAGSLALGAAVDGWNVTLGATTDAACGSATGNCSLIALQKYANTSINASIPAGTNLIGDVNLRQGGTALSTTNGAYFNQLQGNAVLSLANPTFVRPTDGTNGQVFGPCQTVAATYTPINISTATTTRIVTETAAKKTYICSIHVVTNAANNVAMIEGTGASCSGGTPAGMAGGTTASSGWNFSANGGIALGNGQRAIAATANQAYSVCLVTSAATQLSGTVGWVQQ